MKRFIIFLIYIQTTLTASFFEDEDPMHYYHANVVTGHLDLNFHDLDLKSPIPFSITRNYTSAGALERSYDDTDIHLKKLSDSEWMLQGGWSLLSHANLLVRGLNAGGQPKAFLRDKNSSSFTSYSYYKKKKGFYYLRPKIKNHRASGNLSSRKNPKNNTLKISRRKAILKLADGTERHYSGYLPKDESYWQLDLEILPSKHRIAYFYSNEKKPVQIQIQNPEGTKAFATIDFDESTFEDSQALRAKTSDGRTLEYQLTTEFKERTYHDKAKTPSRPQETYHYQPGRKGIGARIGGMSFGDKEEFRVEYYHPKDDDKAKTWAKNLSKHVEGDKVQCLRFPDPKTGEFVTFAEFKYFPNSTEITDYEGNWTVYNHDKEKLLSIQYHDRNHILHSQVEFKWKDGNLTEKKLLDPTGRVLFSKTFIYNDAGNIIEEHWQDHVTRLSPVRRKFTYSKYRMVLSDEEFGGLSHQYEYLPHSDLMTKRLTLDKGKILLREFFKYNKDNLLIQTVTDDGSHSDFGCSTDVTERKVQTFELDPSTGLCKSMSKFAFDLKKCTNRLIQKHDYTYNEKREVIADVITYGNSKETYTIYMEYDAQGRVIKKTSPLGRECSFTYDPLGNLLTSKEPGTPLKQFEYDHANRPKTCTENGKTTHSTYDIKGRLLAQTDRYGNVLHQSYDCFGNCIETHFPKSLNTEGNIYTPKATFSHDILGNILTTTNPRKETTSTAYNILRKPTCITNPDGTKTHHEYNAQGSISKTIYPDQTEIHFTYDPFQRMTYKTIRSPNGEILSEETWAYNTFHLLSYTDSAGLTTQYQYDIMGRKIAETAKDRTLTFAYDAFGYLDRVTQEGFSKVEKHNCEGDITEQWEEDAQGTRENHMLFDYDSEGRKTKAIRITSQGEAEDHFLYDEDGHLTKHTDPHGESSQFLYTETINSLGQTVEQKTIIDSLGNATIETFDANHRLVSIEKKDPDDQTVSSEELFYDEAGNRTKRTTTIYEKNTPIRHYTTTWLYNENGQVIQEIEEDQKTTSFFYDTRGRLIKRILPTGTVLCQNFDRLDRLLEIKSSDKTVHYTYVYEQAPFPIEAKDHIQHLTWRRAYNIFGEITSETRPNGTTLSWTYDTRGRCTALILPDNSSIHYGYSDLHLTSITRHSTNGQYTHNYTQFDENGHVAEEDLIHNLGTITTTHDLLERTSGQQTPWHTTSIEYGPSGLVTKTENSLFSHKDYQYDPLSQLLKEGDLEHHFDSLGNPLDAQVNHLNQVTSTPTSAFIYDNNGNPIRKHTSSQSLTYAYDALNRLTTLHSPDEKHIHYLYDPFNRLYSKETSLAKGDRWSREVIYYLYDQEKEIGTLDEQSTIRELKVLGLGILGDIGAAIAIELNDQIYTPLHDFSGNIIALITPNGKLTDKCDIDAFGKAILTTPSSNPWRFHSKRTEGDLIFFGNRFYDPSLGRWLTPDPAGSIESPNLYLYVRNSPLNRLDLFGLDSEEREFRSETHLTPFFENSIPYFHTRVYYQDIQIDLLTQCCNYQQLQFSPEELHSGSFEILDHFQDLLPKDGMGIALGMFQSGIGVQPKDFFQSAMRNTENFSDCDIVFNIHTPTKGMAKDIRSTFKEKNNIDTPESIITRQLMLAIAKALDKVNPDLKCLHIPHSRGGATYTCAFNGMSDTEQKIMAEKMIVFGSAPASPISNNMALEAHNMYSKDDNITGPFGRTAFEKESRLPENERQYNIEFLSCISSWREKSLYMTDHAYLGKTQQEGVKSHIKQADIRYGFIKNSR